MEDQGGIFAIVVAKSSVPKEDITIFTHIICSNLDHKVYKTCTDIIPVHYE